MLEISLRKEYAGFRLDLDARSSARTLGVVGPSGSGKSTLLKCIAGVTLPDTGRVVVDGRSFGDTDAGVAPLAPRLRRIAYVAQDGLLFPHLSVRRNLRYGLNAHGPGPAFDDVVDVLALEPLLDRVPRTLSGGEARRVALGRALLSGPRLLLLDEPLTGLDRSSAGRTIRYLKTVLHRYAVRAIYVSHSISEVLFLCDDAWILERGRLIAEGSPRDVVTQVVTDPALNADLRNLFSAECERTTGPEGTRYVIGNQRLVTAENMSDAAESVLLSVPAADILLARVRPQRISARNVLKGTVTRLEERGGRVLAFVDVGVEWMVLLTPGAVTELELSPGADVFVIVKASSVVVLST